jgi:D-amino-acid dehydrogenase
MTAPDVAIIGGGILGTATAAFLAESGVSVRLYEAVGIAAGASGRNSGIVQHPFDPVLAGLYRDSLIEYRRLAAGAAVGAGAGFRIPEKPAGLMLVGHDERPARTEAARWADRWPAARPEILRGSELLAREPALARDLVAVRLEIGFPVAPAAAAEAFAAASRASGADLRVGSAAIPAIRDGRATGVHLDGARFEAAGAVVVAAGSWTPALIDPSGVWRPIRASWGVIAGIDLAGAPRHALEAIDIDIEPAEGEAADVVDFSLVPADGSSALGSTFLASEPDPGAWIDPLRTNGARYVPGVASAPLVGVRRCARPVSLDGRPLLGPAPGIDGLWIAAGHGPWGISTGPGSARLLADALLADAGAPKIPRELAAGRFGEPRYRQDSGSSR